MSARERQDQLLRQIVAADDAASGTFFTASSQDGTTLFHPGFGTAGQIEIPDVGDIKALEARGLLTITEYREVGDVAFVVTPQGHSYTAALPRRGLAQTTETDPERRVRELAFGPWRDGADWPRLGDLQREAEHRGEILDIEDIARSMDRSIGWIDESAERRITLKVRGFADLEGAEPITDAFLSALHLIYERYASNQEHPEVTNEDLVALGLSGDLIRRLYPVLEREWFLLGGGGSTGDAWHREPSPSIRHFRAVQTINEYLAVVDTLTGSPQPSGQRLVVSTEAGGKETQASPIPGYELMHPEVLRTSADHFSNGQFGSAVFDAFKALEVRVRQMTGSPREDNGSLLVGQRLMSKAFGGKDPVLAVRASVPEMAADEQDGFNFLFMGLARLRDLGAHDFPELDARRAAIYLSFASLLHDCLDNTTVRLGRG